MLKAAKAMKEGGSNSTLIQKPTGLVQIRVCLTSDTNKITDTEIKSLVSADANAVAVADVSKAVVIEKPVKDDITKRSCGTVAYPPKTGKTEAEVKIEFANIVKALRRALGGRKLNGDEYTTSSGEVNEIVTAAPTGGGGNDPNAPNDPNDPDNPEDSTNPEEATDEPTPEDDIGNDGTPKATPDYSINAGVIAAAVLVPLCLVLLVGGFVWSRRKQKKNTNLEIHETEMVERQQHYDAMNTNQMYTHVHQGGRRLMTSSAEVDLVNNVNNVHVATKRQEPTLESYVDGARKVADGARKAGINLMEKSNLTRVTPEEMVLKQKQQEPTIEVCVIPTAEVIPTASAVPIGMSESKNKSAAAERLKSAKSLLDAGLISEEMYVDKQKSILRNV